MIYMPLLTSQAELLNRAIYRLTQPDSVRPADYVTDDYCTIYHHPTNGMSVLMLPEDETIGIHHRAGPEQVVASLEVFVQLGNITQQELDGIAAAVVAYAGQRVPVAGFIPASWQPYIMTEEQARQVGYLPSGEDELVITP